VDWTVRRVRPIQTGIGERPSTNGRRPHRSLLPFFLPFSRVEERRMAEHQQRLNRHIANA
jgi:hypothetical protein